MTFSPVEWVAGGIFIWLVIILFVLMMWHGSYRARAHHESTPKGDRPDDKPGV